jgi:hypothetical protein
MANTFKFGNGNWAVKDGSALAYNDENNNFKPLPFDFTRASSATTLNRQGLIETVPSGKPRIDFTDNTSGHLLLEPSRTNLVQRSEEFDNAYWTKNGSSVTSGFISPDGTDNAFKLTKTSSGNSIVRLVSGLTNVNYTFSIYIKKVNVSGNVSIILPNGGSTQVTISNEWERYEVTSLPSGGTGAFVGVILSTIGDEVLIYGAQLEQGSYATSYIPTEGSSVTRVVELCNDASISAQVNNDAGAFFVEIQSLEDGSSSSRRITLSDESSSNRLMIETDESTGTFKFFIAGGGTVRTIATSTGNTQTDVNKLAIGYDGVNAKAYINGTQVGSITNATTRTGIDTIDIADWNGTSQVYYGKITSIKVYNTALTDTELQNLTS